MGQSGQALIGTDRRAFILKKGVTSGSMFSKQFNSWDYANISGIELKTGMASQAIVVQVPGVTPVTKVGQMAKGPNSAWEAPNAIMVQKNVDLTATTSLLRQLIAAHHQPVQQSAVQTPSAPSPADPIEQVKRLGELRDSGLLTNEEFEKKKRELLGL